MAEKRRPGEGLRAYEKRIGAAAGSITKKGGILGKKTGGILQKANLKTAKGALKAQQAINQQVAEENKVGQTGPQGSLTWDADSNSWITARTPEEQAIADQEQQRATEQNRWASEAQKRAEGALSSDFSYEGLAGMPTQEGLDAFKTKMYDQAYNTFMRDAQPRMEQERARFDQKMAQEGIPIGSELYKNERDRLEQSQNNAILNAQAQAYSSADSAGNNYYNQGLQSHQQAISDYTQQRAAPFSEYQQISGSARGGYDPNFATPQGTQQTPVDVVGASTAYQTLANQAAAIRKSGASGGGATGYVPWTDAQWADYEKQKDLTALYGGYGPYGNQNSNQPNVGSSIVGGVAQGFGQGLGQGIGSYIGS